jgi:hypothetical protein
MGTADPELDRWRRRCDPLGDGVLDAIEAEGERGRDLLGICRRLAQRGDARCATFLDAVRRTPSWARPAETRAGQRLFERNGPWILMLGFPVLIDSYAGANDNKVLVMSGRLGNGAFARLVETARFTAAVCTRGSLAVERAGFRSALSVRLLHAWVRRLCRRAGYDVERYDEPINQEAMCGTLMLFSHGVLTCARRMGMRVTEDEAESWHALWRHVGWLLGIDEALLPETYAEEIVLYERIKAHQYYPDADTTTLFEAAIRDVTRGAKAQMPAWFTALGGWTLQSPGFLAHFTRRCVDPVLAEHLGLRPDRRWDAILDALALSNGALGHAHGRSRALERASRALNGTLVRKLPPALSGTREEPRYDDPGFRGLRAAS